jgi:5'-nucleotidase
MSNSWILSRFGSHAINEMRKEGYYIKFCSTPQIQSTSHSDKCAWIDEHFGYEMAENLILTHDKTLIKGNILIDDKVNVKGIQKPEWTHILFRTPYNIDSNPQYVLETWYHDWKSLFQQIL